MMLIVNLSCGLYRRVVKRVNPKGAHHKEMCFFFLTTFCIVSILMVDAN